MSEGTTSDGSGSVKGYAQVAAELRAQMTDGTYRTGMALPTQRELAEKFGVSRDTIQRALRELSSEGWIASRRGSGIKVIKEQRIHSTATGTRPDRMITLDPLIDRAFERQQVNLDVFTLTSESLENRIRNQRDRIREHAVVAPESIAVRMLLPSESLDLPYWKTRDGADNGPLRERYLALSRFYATKLRSVLRSLEAEALVPSVTVEIRRISLTPQFKLYLLNGAEAVFGPYLVYRRPIELEDGRRVEDVLDVEGVRAGLIHHVKDSDDPYGPGAVFVDSMQAWFDSVWNDDELSSE
ncbi:GntR family transcriptional regulator [Streptomyces sp. Root369]|uniref:GntR family transcriptional regulator n=1 Tax=Streptomyces sp. Root369 TaxID=1736523 RepID=UPI00070C1078|nr:GntR family transcriptional regulator [Streptomyces sp. Root369]KQW16934.1 GntR family transcriptional regulator [Streptomyces sp. Root369]